MIKYVLPVAILIGATAPAFAAEYYVVRGPDKKCKVVETRPTDKTVVVVGDKAYVTREEAARMRRTAMKRPTKTTVPPWRLKRYCPSLIRASEMPT